MSELHPGAPAQPVPGALHESDYDQVLALNEAAIPAVNSIPPATLRRLHEQAVCAPVMRDHTRVRAFALMLDESAQYESLNFRWFKQNYAAFIYVDRIVVAPECAGQGIGRALYQVVGPVAARRGVILGCDVNLEPPNPASIAFHERLGFRGVHEQLTEGGAKRVSLMVNPEPGKLALD